GVSFSFDPGEVVSVAGDERDGCDVGDVVGVPLFDEVDDLVGEVETGVHVHASFGFDFDGALPAVGAGDGGVEDVGAGDQAGVDEFAGDAVEGVVGGAGDDDFAGRWGLGAHGVSRSAVWRRFLTMRSSSS